MKRLPKGFGSVQKLSGSRRKPYGAKIMQGYNENGKQIYKYIGYYSTKEEAIIALTEYNKNPYDLNLINSTVADIWEIFKKRRFNKISKSGQGVYNAAYKHLKPLHNKYIKDIKTYQLQTLIDNIPRKWQTKSHTVTLLNQLFDIAIELDIIQKNYAKFIILDSKPKSDIHKVFTQSEIQSLFRNIFSCEWADTILIMLFSGLRPSELLKIRTENIYLDERYIIAGSKTKAGKNRIIPINEKVFPFIRKRYNSNNKYFIQEKQLPLEYASYRKHFEDTMTTLNMKHLPHDCRHTFASLMDSAGANKVAVKLIMGHAQKDITDNIYTHKNIDELLKNINLI